MNDTKELHYKYNLFYLAIIMLAVIIALITIKWGGIQGLVDYISFGLTLTSLFLALIAIIYAIISNTTFSQHLGTLRNATQGIADAASSLSTMTTTLEAKLVEIPGMIRNVETKLDETRKDIKAGVAQQTAVASPGEVKDEPPKGIDPGTFVAFFLDRSSFNGLRALYTAQLAYSTKKPFDITKVWANSSLSMEYGFAYLIACTATGMMNHTTKDNMWSVTFMAKQMPNLRDRLLAWLGERAKEKPETWNVEEEMTTMVTPIEEYFRD